MPRLYKRGKMFYSNVEINGKQVRRPLSIYRPEAQTLVDEMVRLRDAAKHGESPKNLSWKFFTEDYLRKSKVNKNKKTYLADQRAFDLVNQVAHLTKLHEMTPERLDGIQVRLKEQKIKPGTIARSIRAMKTVMHRAEDLKYMPPQNWRLVKIEEPQGRMDFYEVTAYQNLLLSLSGVYLTAAWLMGRAGLRLGEALHIEWRDVQFSNRRIIFRSKPQFNWRIKGDKKLKKVRTVQLAEDLQLYLESIAKPDGFVLEVVGSRSLDVFSRQMRRVLAKTGVETYLNQKPFSHILRHTFGSHLAQAGVDDKVIAELMGHNSTRMVEIYSHLRPVDMQRGVLSLKKLVPDLYRPKKQVGVGIAYLDQNNAQLVKAETPSKSSEKHL